MTNSDNCELPLNNLKDVSGGFTDNCEDKMAQAKMMRKVQKKGKEWCEKPDNRPPELKWSGIEMQEN